MNERLWFSQAVQSLFLQALGGRISPSLKSRLEAVGLNLDKLEPAYSSNTFAAAVRLTASELFPSLDPDAASYRLGELFSDGHDKTIIGRALFGLLKLLGPKRTLPRMGRNLRSITNFLDATVTEILPDRFEIKVHQVDLPYFIKGMIDGTGRILGAPRETSDQLEYEGQTLTLYVDLRGNPVDAFPQRTA